MAYMRIHCESCGGTWEVYGRDNWKSDQARTCPHCYSEIDKQTWDKQILPAFGAVRDGNAELIKDHTGYRRPLFTVDFMGDRVKPGPPAAEHICPLLEDLSNLSV